MWFMTAILVTGTAGVSGWTSAGDRITVQNQHDAATGSYVVVPIEASADFGFDSASFKLAYSTALLTPIGVYTTPLTRDFELSFDIDTPGDLTVDLRGPNPQFESGEIVWVLFDNHGAPNDRANLTLHHALLNDLDTVDLRHGWIERLAGEVTLSIPTDLTAGTGEMITAPLSVDDATGILAIDLELEFAPDVLNAVNVALTPISQDFSLITNLSTPGIIRIAMFGAITLTGSGPILEIDFEVVGGTGQSTPIQLATGQINEGGIPALFQDGFFSVRSSCELDWNCDGVVDFADLYDSANGGFYQDWRLYDAYHTHPEYGPYVEGGWYHKAHCGEPGNLDWDGNGVVEYRDVYGGQPSSANLSTFYTQRWVYVNFPDYYDYYYPDSSCE
jgi:hypothetical protein